MVRFSLRSHPDVLFAYKTNSTGLIVRVENPAEKSIWAEAEINVPEQLSLAPSHLLQKGRLRVGIIGKGEFLEKSVKIYANSYTSPQMYHCPVTLFIFNHDGVIAKRMEKSLDVRCELKKDASL